MKDNVKATEISKEPLDSLVFSCTDTMYFTKSSLNLSDNNDYYMFLSPGIYTYI